MRPSGKPSRHCPNGVFRITIGLAVTCLFSETPHWVINFCWHLGRVVSTKVYLSSKGVDVVTRQHLQSWRKKFLQKGMSGSTIVYGNGHVDNAMASFPRDDGVLQDIFVAVFTGPESDVILYEAEQEEQQ